MVRNNRTTRRTIARSVLAGVALLGTLPAPAQTVSRVDQVPPGLRPLPATVTGRVETAPDGSVRRQWPGTYMEAGLEGDSALFTVGPGDVSLRVSVDGRPPVPLVKPTPGTYRVTGFGPGVHRLRVAVASESQAGPTSFGGFLLPRGVKAAPLAHRRRAIEFIGDSHTVGYGNTATTRDCSQDQVWATTDTTRGLAALTAARYGADFEVNAISGRGVVRNYNGFAADTLPQAYPFALFDKAQPARDAAWHPQVIVIALGTNDFSTPLHTGEKWATRDQLHADFEATYVAFVGRLRALHPHALIVLWATDLADGEIEAEAGRVVAQLRAAGDARVGLVPVHGLAFSACHAHPSLADDQMIANAIAAFIDAQPRVWTAARE